MSNTLTGLMPSLYEALDTVSREMIGLIPAVNRDTSVARAAKGQAVTSFITPVVTASDIVPAVTAPNDGDQVLTSLQVTISKARRIPIRWNGEEQLGLNNNGAGANRIIVDQFSQAMRGLVLEIETDLVSAGYKGASRAYGTPGTAPFGVNGDFTDFSNMHQILDDNGAPMLDRQLALGSAAINNIRGKQSLLFKANEAGSDALLRRGIIADIEGFGIHNSFGIKPITKGTGTSYVLGGGPYSIGATVLTLATGSGNVNAGDVITLAGDTNKYVVVSGNTGPGTVAIGSPGLRAAHAAGDAVSLSNSFTPNLAFSRQALILATRAPALPVDMTGRVADSAIDRTTLVDPVSGIGFEVSMYLQYRQIQYEVALAWGAGVVKPDNIAVLMG